MTNVVPVSRLRNVIASVRDAERRLVVLFHRGWAMCPGCHQSCTGAYVGHQACIRCNIIVT